ncbi:hypothetical protein [Gluconobacter cerinus]|uniref:hypothetical protein n=1 Tax=Gluconobacter cerinus TaxID=38307 RepID=UPI001B8B0250|nr:hypothetical protein [Gluconobacter cerinus]MBS1025126.1 hypothetical protein [Gluconobacter cerinus]MBS1042812.1 hypothetical protein [Gluconobacter cerinus]
MQTIWLMALLLIAAFLEVGGDALVRTGLHAAGLGRVGFISAGALVLLIYGITVNLPDWDFGRLMGVYVALFFIAAQVVAYFAFGQTLTLPVCIGGLLIVSGGVLMTVWR